MKLHIVDEYSPLKDVVVCWGYGVADAKTYASDDPEFSKYHKPTWDKELLLKQQEAFFKKMEKYGVKLYFPETNPQLIWQMFTRDTGFVIGDCFYYSGNRAFKERLGEIDILQKLLTQLGVEEQKEITQGNIDGGDVLVTREKIYVGNGSRTNADGIKELLTYVHGERLHLGDHVMHLDTRFTILPRGYALVIAEAFTKEDLAILQRRFKLLYVLPEEAHNLGTNVFMVNPETIFSPTQNTRINGMLRKEGFNLEVNDYSEPIKCGGSFRCTTLPLIRA